MPVLTAVEKNALAFLKSAEHAIASLDGTAPCHPLVNKAVEFLNRVKNFCWAIRTFPTFDPSCLGRMVKQHVKAFDPDDRRFDQDKKPIFEGDLWLPALACAKETQQWEATCLTNYMPAGGVGAEIPEKYIQENKALIEAYRQTHKVNNWTVRFTAQAPAWPQEVYNRVARHEKHFEYIATVFEADWVPSVVKDPLVIGYALDRWFVIDKFDLTQLERYVSSEYCQDPKKE